MKRTLAILLVMIISVTCLFAATNKTGTGITDSSGTSTELSFTLTESEIATYQIGFSSDATADFSPTQPTDMPIIALTYSREQGKAVSDQAYVYYNVNATAMPKLSLTPGAGLKKAGDEQTVIAYKIVMDNNNQSIASGTKATQISNVGAGFNSLEGKGHGFIGFKVETTTPITAAMAAAGTPYKDTIILTIASGL